MRAAKVDPITDTRLQPLWSTGNRIQTNAESVNFTCGVAAADCDRRQVERRVTPFLTPTSKQNVEVEIRHYKIIINPSRTCEQSELQIASIPYRNTFVLCCIGAASGSSEV